MGRPTSRLTPDECGAACGVAHYVQDVEESKRLTRDAMPKIIISASGMATGGRVLHHLASYADDPANLILFSGFQATALKAVKCGHSARQWIEDYLGTEAARAIDRRLQVGLVGLEPGIGPAALAQRLGLSPARLREVAVRDFGVPTAKLLQWLQLQQAIEALQQSQNLADAAAAGGFADQAHFTRRLVEWFGVTPAQGLARLEISVIR